MDIILGLCAAIVVAVALIILFRNNWFIYVISAILILATLALCFEVTFIVGVILMCLFVAGTCVFLFANLAEIRKVLVPHLGQGKTLTNNLKYSKDTLYHIIDDAVHSLSRTKTGGIMTFEKNTSLDDEIKSGTIINAPVSQELIETIFFNGTRLHDGALVIRENVIVAASVYFTPTTKALQGKYGSRHRAAIGISEVSDAVTVVGSEETGRVSIAHGGDLEPIALDLFLSEFTELMNK